jgi:hypothetical protein
VAEGSVTDVAPRTRGHMHKTPSLDFLVVHKGQITLHLEGGVKQSIGAGEAIGEFDASVFCRLTQLQCSEVPCTRGKMRRTSG